MRSRLLLVCGFLVLELLAIALAGDAPFHVSVRHALTWHPTLLVATALFSSGRLGLRTRAPLVGAVLALGAVVSAAAMAGSVGKVEMSLYQVGGMFVGLLMGLLLLLGAVAVTERTIAAVRSTGSENE